MISEDRKEMMATYFKEQFVFRTLLKLIILLPIIFGFSVSAAEEKITVPAMFNLGIGFGQVFPNTPLLADEQPLNVLKLDLHGTVEKETLAKHRDKFPEDAPSWLADGDISVGYAWVPDSIYFSNGPEAAGSVYGFRTGPDIGARLGSDLLSLKLNVGAKIKYLYMDSVYFDDNHYLSLGLHTGYSLLLKPARYVHFEIGRDHSWEIANQLSNGKQLGSFTEEYVMLHIRIPFEFETKI